MNDESPIPPDAAGADPVEARIVAWVLGEASAFEAAELERLCGERPELRSFRDRIREIHGMLEPGQTDDRTWKLAPSRRAKLDEIFGTAAPLENPVIKERRIEKSGKRALFAMVACVALSFGVTVVVYPILTKSGRPDLVARGGVDVKMLGKELSALEQDIRIQSDEVEKRRKTLTSMAKTKAIMFRPTEEDIREAREEKARLESLVGSFPKPGDESAIAHAAGLDPRGNEVRELYPYYLEANKELELQRQSGMGDHHPAVLAGTERVRELKSRLDDGVTRLRDSHQWGLAQATKGLENLESLAARPPDSQLYQEAKTAFEKEMAVLQAMKARQSALLASGATVPGSHGSGGGISIAKNESTPRPAISPAPAVLPMTPPGNPPESDVRMELPEIARNDRERKPEPMSRFGMGAGGGRGAGQSPADAVAIAGKDVGEARVQQDVALAADAGSARAKREGEEVDDAIRSNPALTQGHVQNVDQVRRGLYTAEGNFNLGKYDDAKREYENVLRVDPANAAARRGIERAQVAKSDYYRAAYDQTRAELLSQNDEAWKLSAPSDSSAPKPVEPPVVFAGRGERSRLAPPAPAAPAEAEAGALADSAPGQAGSSPSQPKPGDVPVLGRLYAPQGNAANAQEQAEGLATARDHKGDPLANPGEYFFRGSDLEGGRQPSNPIQDHLLGKTPMGETAAAAQEESQSRAGLNLSKRFQEPAEAAEAKDMDAMVPLPEQEKAAPVVEELEEIPASQDPYSTFSLNVSDASFQVAKAALDKGERPDPAGIKVEQFYNAVDYGDPAPGSDEPVAATIEQAAHPVIPGRNLVRVALRTGATGRDALQPLSLTLLVDQSGSMVRDDRRVAMDHALSQLSVLLTKEDRINVIGFSRTPRLLAEAMPGDQANRLPDLVNQSANEGGTHLESAMKLAVEIAERHRIQGAQNRIVLLTDGATNLGDADPGRLATQVKSIRQKGIAFDIAGIGADELNDRLLGELARNGNGRYYVVGSDKKADFARQLAGAFRPAAENVKVQVRFNPQRVGRYKLVGFEKDRLKTEDFRNDSVDAAELAAEETGVAIYQVETLPEGSGEIGEVFARFRDAASGTMVERSWTIPHEEAAAPFDRATPSLQLAGLSMLAAEKLRGGPLADAIDFNRLAGPAAAVKHHYRASPRVAEMLRVVDALK